MAKPEWLIVGLGNPGGEYNGTRHNVGWEVIELLAQRYRAKLDRSKHRARYGAALIEDVPVLLVKPLTFMNLSGQAVAPIMRENGLTPARVLVIADDMDLALGKIRLKLKGSAGGHNGHKSLIHSLRTQDYPRLKIGIGKGEDDAIDHVLGPFTPAERTALDGKLALCADAAVALVTRGEAGSLRVLEADAREES
ncbi:MAG: aminoacyl-tRNA hydrolase [Fimbriimonadaceae bacterium]